MRPRFPPNGSDSDRAAPPCGVLTPPAPGLTGKDRTLAEEG